MQQAIEQYVLRNCVQFDAIEFDLYDKENVRFMQGFKIKFIQITTHFSDTISWIDNFAWRPQKNMRNFDHRRAALPC